MFKYYFVDVLSSLFILVLVHFVFVLSLFISSAAWFRLIFATPNSHYSIFAAPNPRCLIFVAIQPLTIQCRIAPPATVATQPPVEFQKTQKCKKKKRLVCWKPTGRNWQKVDQQGLRLLVDRFQYVSWREFWPKNWPDRPTFIPNCTFKMSVLVHVFLKNYHFAPMCKILTQISYIVELF